MSIPAVEPEYVDRKAASWITSVPVATLATLKTRGGGPPFIKRGSKVLYKRTDLIAWLEAGRKVPAESMVAQQAPKPWERGQTSN